MTSSFMTKGFLSGAMYAAIGAFAVYFASGYRFGSLARMGPGYFPTALGVLLIAVGVICMARAIYQGDVAVEGIAWRPLALIFAATFGFGVLLPLLGLPLALLYLIGVGSLASRLFSLDLTFVAGMAFFVIACIGLFVYGLGLSMPLLGSLF